MTNQTTRNATRAAERRSEATGADPRERDSCGPPRRATATVTVGRVSDRRPEVYAWSPTIDGITEVLHARFTDHAYPMHLHDTWALLVVDEGAVRYELGGRAHEPAGHELARHEHDGSRRSAVTLLPPNVPHNGTPVGPRGFRKRVLYLDPAQLADELIGPAVDRPTFADPVLWRWLDRLHVLLAESGPDLAVETHLALVVERLRAYLTRRPPATGATGGIVHDPPVAHRLRDLLDEHVVAGVTLREASRSLHVNPTYLVRAFSREFGIGPHQHLISRRVDLARRLLRDGLPAGEVAAAVGFYDQSHLNRHFKRILGFSPGQYGRAASPRRPGSPYARTGPFAAADRLVRAVPAVATAADEPAADGQ